MSPLEITQILARHAAWRRGEAEAERVDLSGANLILANLHRANLHRADLHGADLYRADLREADLREANLHGADLYGANLILANLREANLHRADLHGANLILADLHRANLHRADLREADLREANLHGADLSGADLREADLYGAVGLPNAPVIPHIDAVILHDINGGKIEMRQWHSACGMAHCRGGWAIFKAGDAGAALENATSPYLAARLIYEASRPGIPCPDFYCSNEMAMADLRACAVRDPI